MVFAMAIAWNLLILCALLQTIPLSCRAEDDPKAFAAESVLQDDGCDVDESPGLELLQKVAMKKRSRSVDLSESNLTSKSWLGRSKYHRKATTTTTTSTSTSLDTTTISTTTLAGVSDYLVLSTVGEDSSHAWVYRMDTGKLSYLVKGIDGDGGIAFDNYKGYFYVAGSNTIVRYVMAIREGHMMEYDFQPVVVAINVNPSAITITDESSVLYTDYEKQTINKIYDVTMILISTGQIQVENMEKVDYKWFLETYGQYGETIPEMLTNENCTCYQKGYVFVVYYDVGYVSSLESYTGSTFLMGMLHEGYKRGSVLQAETSPKILKDGTLPKPKALTHAWDSVYGFQMIPATDYEDASPLFMTLNGTMGDPPIVGDVTGALVAEVPPSANWPTAQSTVMAWDFKKPRGVVLYRGGDETVMVADETGVTCMSSALIMEGVPQTKLLNLTNVVGLLIVTITDDAIPLMVKRGDNNKIGQ
jgi:hypothetical protein